MNGTREGSVRAVARNQGSAQTDHAITKGVEVVYYLRLKDGLIKIGTSRDMLSRLNKHRSLKGDIEVLAVEFGGKDLERQRHQEFASDRQGKAEHFQPSDALMNHIAGLRDSLNLSA